MTRSIFVAGSTAITRVTEGLVMSAGSSTVFHMLSIRASLPNTTFTSPFVFFANSNDIFVQASMEDGFDLS
jgi:hypothetical protein